MSEKPARKKPKKTTSKMKSLSQTHGKEESFKPTTLAQIWGDDGISKYGTLNETEYVQKIDEMHFSDLKTHAADLGLIPVDYRHLLSKRLLSEFRSHVNEYTTPVDNDAIPDSPSEKVRKILEEGK